MFITFEGLDGSGKSTQCKKLVSALEVKGHGVLLTREPGGTAFAEKIRNLLLENGGIPDPLTEYLLFTAARVDHVNKVIKPGLEGGKIVICDRFYDSSVIYQGVLKGLDLGVMEDIYNAAIGNFTPDLTIFIDISPELAIKRSASRAEVDNHYDKIKLKKLSKMREGYINLCQKTHERSVIIEGDRCENDVFEQIYEIVSRKLG
jgi:dTMP kinase